MKRWRPISSTRGVIGSGRVYATLKDAKATPLRILMTRYRLYTQPEPAGVAGIPRLSSAALSECNMVTSKDKVHECTMVSVR